VGTVRLSLVPVEGGFALTYSSETWVRRGPARTHNSSHAALQLEADRSIRTLEAERFESGIRTHGLRRDLAGLVPKAWPSSLALAQLGAERRCVPVVEETTGRSGEACGERTGAELRGTLLGERYLARFEGERLERLELPEQRVSFERTAAAPVSIDPPDLFSAGARAEGLEGLEESGALTLAVQSDTALELPPSESQRVQRREGEVLVTWQRIQGTSAAWEKAAQLARLVDEKIADKRPGPFERWPERALAEGRGACVAHAEAFIALAGKEGIKARRALGLVAGEGKLWPHAWAQIEIAGRWYDVDPSEAAAPARSVRILFAAGDAADEQAAARLASLMRTIKISVRR
jgi:hypothetical protein